MHTGDSSNLVPSAGNSTSLHFKYEHWFASSYEKNFDYYSKRQWLKDHLYVPYLIAAIYLASIYIGQKWMKNRQAYQLKGTLVVWNVVLAIFSITGSLRTIPWFVAFVRSHGLHASCCFEPDVSGVYGFWSWAFILSKIPELGDTFFIIARKQKLIFLHWFHHVSVLFFVWYSNSENFSIGSWFITMNYFIHSFMYVHFALRAMKIQISSKVPLLITTLQLLQMAAGTEITFYAYSQIRRSQTSKMCDTHIRTLYISLFLYGSYLILFANFFLMRYVGGLSFRVEWKKNLSINTLTSSLLTLIWTMRTDDELTPSATSEQMKKLSPITTEQENNRSINNNTSKDSLKLD